MPFNSGTGVTDHIDMLDVLTDVLTSRYLASVAVNAGGTGYVVGDILGIDGTGATSTRVAQLEVTSVSAGVVTGLRVYRSGSYSVDPTTTTGNTTSGGTGTGCTANLTMSAATWAVNRRTQEAASATIAAGGTGYVVGDLLTLTDDAGTVHDDAGGSAGLTAIAYVTSVSSGVVTGVDFTSTGARRGNYGEVPANPVSTTGGTGTGCTLTVTWQDGTFAENEEQMCFLEGEGLAGTDAIHVWIKPFSAANGFDTAYNWAIGGMTGYDNTLPLQNQAGVNTTATVGQISSADGSLQTGISDTGAYVVLKNDDADPDMSWWISWTGRRFIMVVKVEGSSTTIYSSCYAGFLNQLATDTEYPYPMWICGTTSEYNQIWTDTTNLMGGPTEVITRDSVSGIQQGYGPGYVRTPAGTWLSLNMWSSPSSSSRTNLYQYGIWPVTDWQTVSQGNAAQQGTGLKMVDATNSFIPSSGVPGTPGVQVKPTTGTGDDYYRLWNVIPYYRESGTMVNSQAYGEVDGAFLFFTGNNTIVSEDRFELTTKRYMIFQNGNRTQVWSYFALDED